MSEDHLLKIMKLECTRRKLSESLSMLPSIPALLLPVHSSVNKQPASPLKSPRPLKNRDKSKSTNTNEIESQRVKYYKKHIAELEEQFTSLMEEKNRLANEAKQREILIKENSMLKSKAKLTEAFLKVSQLEEHTEEQIEKQAKNSNNFRLSEKQGICLKPKCLNNCLQFSKLRHEYDKLIVSSRKSK